MLSRNIAIRNLESGHELNHGRCERRNIDIALRNEYCVCTVKVVLQNIWVNLDTPAPFHHSEDAAGCRMEEHTTALRADTRGVCCTRLRGKCHGDDSARTPNKKPLERCSHNFRGTTHGGQSSKLCVQTFPRQKVTQIGTCTLMLTHSANTIEVEDLDDLHSGKQLRQATSGESHLHVWMAWAVLPTPSSIRWSKPLVRLHLFPARHVHDNPHDSDHAWTRIRDSETRMCKFTTKVVLRSPVELPGRVSGADNIGGTCSLEAVPCLGVNRFWKDHAFTWSFARHSSQACHEKHSWN